MPDIDTIIAKWKSSFAGRTRYDGQAPREDEIIIAEVERLRAHCETLHNEIYRLTHSTEPGMYRRKGESGQ